MLLQDTIAQGKGKVDVPLANVYIAALNVSRPIRIDGVATHVVWNMELIEGTPLE